MKMKTVLVTGANRGIGFAIVQKLLKNNYKVIAISKSTNNLYNIKNKNLMIYKCNIENKKQLKKIEKYINENEIKVDILINNLGIGCFDKIEKITIEEFERVIFCNLVVPFYMTKILLPEMKNRNWGRIIMIGSNASFLPEINGSAYCASKFGLRGLCECIKKEIESYNIFISMVNPGRVDTWFNNKKPGDRILALSAEEVADQVVFILSQSDCCNIEYINLSHSKVDPISRFSVS